MDLTDYHFELPDELIAQKPEARRDASRLLVLDRKTGAFEDQSFAQLPALLEAGDMLVFNDTRVIKARLHGAKETGGKVEVMVDRILSADTFLAQVRASKSPKAGSRIFIEEAGLTVIGRHDDLFELSSDDLTLMDLLDQHGEVPLPPYIRRSPEAADDDRYQTVYARNPGAVAAPTAGLHFDDAMLERLNEAGIELGYLTLHVGSGTFQPVRVQNIEEHQMHAEWFRIDASLADRVNATRARGNRVICVGTTSLRALESAYSDGEVKPFEGETDIFIYPGVEVGSCDGLLTNFHLPESTLLMLVSALAGRETILRAYQHAVALQYRFFSYGDAMFIR
ncbi:MAG: tRNA preQ1(34) S-adenosylmethionine ribosyltransferase-isomerase QueA [Pseudomonadota bacterium]